MANHNQFGPQKRPKPGENQYKRPERRTSPIAEHRDSSSTSPVSITQPAEDHAIICGFALYTSTIKYWKTLSRTQKIVRLAMAFALLGIAVEISTGIISAMLKEFSPSPSTSLASNPSALYTAPTSSDAEIIPQQKKTSSAKYVTYSDSNKPYAVSALSKENIAAKIQVVSWQPLSLAEQKTMAEKLARRILAYVTKYPERSYLREVLSQQSLRITAQIPHPDRPLPYEGVYSCCQHGLENVLAIVNPLTIDAAIFAKMLFHESWHAYVAMTKHQGSFPVLVPSPAAENIAYAPFSNPQEQSLYRHAFDDANKRLEYLDQLLDHHDAGTLTKTAAQELQIYIDTLKDYKPRRRWQTFQMPQCERRQSDLASLSDGSRESVYLLDNPKLPLFYDSFKEVEEGIWLTGYLVKDIKTETVRAFVRDQTYIHEFTKNGYRNRANDEITYMTERDAIISELPYPMQKLMYAELLDARNTCGYIHMGITYTSLDDASTAPATLSYQP